MSKGHGRLQRAVLALIAAEPNNAWSLDMLCRKIYGRSEKAQRVAVGRSLRHMKLPGTWSVRYSCGRPAWLCDPCNLASMRVVDNAPAWQCEPGGGVYADVERAKRWRDGSPLERIEMELADLRQRGALLAIAGAGAHLRAVGERRMRLEEEKQKLTLLAELGL